MQPDDLSQIQIENLPSLDSALVEIERRFWAQPFWRGHANFDWKLTAEVFRPFRRTSWRSISEPKWEGVPTESAPRREESVLLNSFMAQAESRHPHCPPITDKVGWLMLARHYGLPVI
jgi:hypothetical protein